MRARGGRSGEVPRPTVVWRRLCSSNSSSLISCCCWCVTSGLTARAGRPESHEMAEVRHPTSKCPKGDVGAASKTRGQTLGAATMRTAASSPVRAPGVDVCPCPHRTHVVCRTVASSTASLRPHAYACRRRRTKRTQGLRPPPTLGVVGVNSSRLFTRASPGGEAGVPRGMSWSTSQRVPQLRQPRGACPPDWGWTVPVHPSEAPLACTTAPAGGPRRRT